MEKMEGISLKKFSIFIIFCIFFSNCISIISFSQEVQEDSNIIYVNPSDNIQQVIDQANVNDTILFSNGLYQQSFRITKPLFLLGESKEHTIFSFKTRSNNAAISIFSSYVTLNQFTIENRAIGLYTTAIRIDASNVFIENCIFRDTPIGIAVWNDEVKIMNSSFSNCSDEGILLISTKISSSENNLISNCVFKDNCDGIELQYSSGNIISDCIFENNTHAGIDAICENNNQNVITNCSFFDNTDFDIYFSSSKENLISNCIIKNYQEKIFFNPSNASNTIIMNKYAIDETRSIHTTESKVITSNNFIDLIRSIFSDSYHFIQTIISSITSKIFQS